MDKTVIEKVLAHHGIKGMKWGVRRKRGKGGRVSSDHTRSRKILSKKLNQLSDDDIKKVNKRLEMEKKLKTLDPRLQAEGKRRAAQFLNTYANATIGGVAGAAAAITVAKITKKGV